MKKVGFVFILLASILLESCLVYPEKETAEDVIFEATYIVEHYKEDLTGTGKYSLAEKEVLKGEIGKETSAVAKNYEGFIANTFSQENIKRSGRTIVQIKYTRERYTIILDANGGTFNNGLPTKNIKNRFETIYSPSEIPEKKYYEFTGWTKDGIPVTFPVTYTKTSEGTYKAEWKKILNAKYTVNHLLQDKNKEYVLASSETLSGIIGELTDAEEKEYKGYKVKTVNQLEIKQDGSTVVNIFYDLIKYKIILEQIEGEDSVTITGYYGDPVIVEPPVREGYVFVEWEPALPINFTEDTQHNAIWKLSNYVSFSINGVSLDFEKDENFPQEILPEYILPSCEFSNITNVNIYYTSAGSTEKQLLCTFADSLFMTGKKVKILAGTYDFFVTAESDIYSLSGASKNVVVLPDKETPLSFDLLYTFPKNNGGKGTALICETIPCNYFSDNNLINTCSAQLYTFDESQVNYKGDFIENLSVLSQKQTDENGNTVYMQYYEEEIDGGWYTIQIDFYNQADTLIDSKYYSFYIADNLMTVADIK